MLSRAAFIPQPLVAPHGERRTLSSLPLSLRQLDRGQAIPQDGSKAENNRGHPKASPGSKEPLCKPQSPTAGTKPWHSPISTPAWVPWWGELFNSGLGGVFGRLSDAFGLGRDAAGQAESRRSWGTPGHTEVRVAACLLLFLWGHCKLPPTALRWWRAGLSFQHALRNNHWF